MNRDRQLIITIILSLILIQTAITCYSDIPFSINSLILNISIAFSIGLRNPLYFIITFIVIELLVISFNFTLDHSENKIINCYEQFNIIQRLNPEKLSYYTEGLYKSGQNHKFPNL